METKLYKNLPLYTLSIDEHNDAFVDAIGIVDTPAIGVNALYFAKAIEASGVTLEVAETNTKQFFATTSKHELLGAVMVPDTKMYRPANDIIPHEHYVMFSAEEIRRIARVFFTKGCMNNINLGHTETTASSNTFISYFIDKDNGISTPRGMPDLPDGTWVVGMHVSDEAVYNKLTQSNFGFSCEGIFQYSSFSKSEVNTTLSQLEEYEQFLLSIKR